jgi:SNF2 family DNA or RNA helicase
VAMLSDSVGLGKTYTAIKVIDYYMFNPEKNQRVVVICPAGLNLNGKRHLQIFSLNICLKYYRYKI